MLLTSVDATNSQGSVLSLPLEDVDTGFVVKNIDGLDPVKATLVSSGFAGMDGEQFHTSRRVPRNIKLSLGLEADYAAGSVKDLRDALYAYFMPKSEVLLGFHMFDKFAISSYFENLDVNILGVVEDFNSQLFTKEPTVDISLMCFDPDFYVPTSTIVNGNTVADATTQTITYDGTVDTGLIFTLNVNRTLGAFSIYHTPPDRTLRQVDFTYNLVAGNVVRINSNVGEKEVVLLGGAGDTSILYAVSPQSPWLELQPGDNTFRVYAAGAPIPFTVEYTTKYGGL